MGKSRAKPVENAFTAREIEDIFDISVEMIDYLAREGYLVPTYGAGRVRGRVRYYSYRDLIIVNVIRHLRAAGVELRRLKKALRALKRDESWFKSINAGRRTQPAQWLVTDGKTVQLQHSDGFLDELKPGGQRSFGFILSMDNIRDETRRHVPAHKLEHFSLENRELILRPQPKPEPRRSRR